MIIPREYISDFISSISGLSSLKVKYLSNSGEKVDLYVSFANL